MSESDQTPENVTVYVDFPEQPGVRQVSTRSMSPGQLAEKSAEALDKAMDTITAMAARAGALGEQMPVEFTKAEIEFSVTLDYKVGALIAEAKAAGSIGVTLTWERPDEG